MKKTYFSFIMLMLFSIGLSAQQTKRVLFIGNSYTAANNLPQMVSDAATSAGDQLIYDAHTPGGARLMQHAASSAAMAKMALQPWDHVVLQAQSQEPSWSWSQMQSEVFPYADTLCDTIRYFNPCAEPMFYMTWGRKNGDQMNCQYVSWVCTYEGMDSALRVGYTHMATQNHAEVSPVGPVWRYIRNQYPNIELYSPDESHPSLAGSYAAACTFYTVIFDKNPLNITWSSSLPTEVADSIKMAAKRMVFDSLSLWNHTKNNITADFSFNTNTNTVDFNAGTTPYDSVYWDFGDGNHSTLNKPTNVFATKGIFTVKLTVYLCGKSDTISKQIQIDAIAGIGEEQESKTLEVFPNPAQNKINIILPANMTGTGKLLIYDAKGACKYVESIPLQPNAKLQKDISQLAPGIYFISLSNDKIQLKTTLSIQ